MVDYTNMQATVEAIKLGLTRLPGLAAQKRMSPIPRKGQADSGIPEGAIPGATILLLYPDQGVPRMVLTKRSQSVAHHKGQISMPGGMVDPGESLEAAALREAQEEIGVPPQAVTLLGPLSPLYIPVSGFVMHPFVGIMSGELPWQLEPREVELVLTPSLGDLINPKNHEREARLIFGLSREVPYFKVAEEKVWGATAMVLAEFLDLLGFLPNPELDR
jgi:8-oxo-dGTP pyrophosphatase MutT (NUDIX family)